MNSWAAVILAAGRGTRMKSQRPKVLHPLCGRPLIQHVLAAAQAIRPSTVAAVVGYGAQEVQDALGESCAYVKQLQQLGTGHALLQCQTLLKGKTRQVLVLNGDLPLISGETLKAMVTMHEASQKAVTLLTALDPGAQGLGQVQRDDLGNISAILETKHSPRGAHLSHEVNAGAYCFDAPWLWKHLPELAPSSRGEVYLTDLIALAYQEKAGVQSLVLEDPAEALGINTRVDLARAEAILRQRVREHWMLEGITLMDPASIFIDATVTLGQDTVIYPHTVLSGSTSIGSNCHVGPFSVVRDSKIADHCRVLASFLEDVTIEEHVDVGPFSHLRNEAHIERDTHIGNFVEVKKSRLGRGTKSGHFSYLGDATIGKNVNIAAGTITCNFDGVRKNPTFIGDDAFIGCDTMLVAPVTVGERAITGAGAVVTKDVPPDTVVVGVPARPMRKGEAAQEKQDERSKAISP